MNIVFLGTPKIAVPSLEALLAAGHRPTLVICQPDRPAGRSSRPIAPPIKLVASAHGIPVEQPRKVRTPEFRDRLAAERPDALVVVAYGRILPAPVLELARLGAVNAHFSLLPRSRGAAPVQWTLARGEVVSGVTTMKVNERLDEGDVLIQRAIDVRPDEHAPGLQERLSEIAAALLVETLTGLDAGSIRPIPQDHARATYAPPLRKEDGDADFSMSAGEIEGRVRGFDPWPGVWARRGDRRIRLVRARARAAVEAPAAPGRILRIENDGFLVACGGGTLLEVSAVQPEGRRAISAIDALHGRVLAPGEQLEGSKET